MSTVLKRHSKGILLQAKEGCSNPVHSNQMVLRTVRREAGSQERLPKALKTEPNQGGSSGSSPHRLDGSCDGQVGGWTSWEAAIDAQGRVRKPLWEAKGLSQKTGVVTAKRFNSGAPQGSLPSKGSGPYEILVVCCINLWPAVRMELGQEGWPKQPVVKVTGTIVASDQGSIWGHQCSETSLTEESQFQKCGCIPGMRTADPLGGTVDPLNQWDCVVEWDCVVVWGCRNSIILPF
jgi:hypothetical protein